MIMRVLCAEYLALVPGSDETMPYKSRIARNELASQALALSLYRLRMLTSTSAVTGLAHLMVRLSQDLSGSRSAHH